MPSEDIDEIDEQVGEDEPVLDADESLEDIEPTERDLAEATVPPEPGIGEVESIQELIAKQDTQPEEEAPEEDEEAILASLTRDDRVEPLDTRVVPMQATEFMCKRCFLVKHRSQLADKKKMLCRDCA
jgi:Domain of unknown function (DUF4193)